LALAYYNKKIFLRKNRIRKSTLNVYLFIYLQLINIITGPDIILKFLGFKYDDVNEIGLGWFTTSVNLIFIVIAALVLCNNKVKSLQFIAKAKKIIIILLLTFFSAFLVLGKMYDQSVNLIFLTIGYFIKICSLIVLFDKYDIEFSTTLLNVLKLLVIIMLLYITFFFANGFSTTLLGRYQSVFSQPNTLGQFSSLTIGVLFSDRLYGSSRKKANNLSFIFFLLIGIVFIIISQSFTNLLLIILILLMYYFYLLKNKILHFLLLTAIVLFAYFFYTNSKDLSILSFSNVTINPSNFDRDLTLTGRTQIWRDVLDKVQLENNSLFGYGIGGFWGKTGSPSSKIDNALFMEIGQAHNGLIDLYIQYGLIGLTIFVCFLFNILNKLSKIKSNSKNVFLFNFFFVLFLFNNLVESSYLQPKNFLNVIFVLIVVYILNSETSLRNRKYRLNRIDNSL